MNAHWVPNQHPLFAPPVELPMRFRAPRGVLGAHRIRSQRTVTTPSGSFSYQPLQAHGGVDLLGDHGAPVFAARAGLVVNTRGSGNDRKVAIRHVDPGGLGFVTTYKHLEDLLVSVGNQVFSGQLIGFIGDSYTPRHLHFELAAMLNNTTADDWNYDNTALLDPIAYLYPWEKIYFEGILGNTPSTQSPALLEEVAVMRTRGMAMFRVKQHGRYLFIPLYHLDAGDRQMVDLLQQSYLHQKQVRLATRQSPFFDDLDIITAARVIG